MHRLHYFLLAAIALSLGACASKHYKGYKYAPYTVNGVDYFPMRPEEALDFVEIGTASHYREGGFLRAGQTAIGERYSSGRLAGAHKTIPLPARIKVTNLKNEKWTIIRLNDRGPYIDDRILDVTPGVAKKLGFYEQGLTPVRIEVLSVGDGRYRID